MLVEVRNVVVSEVPWVEVSVFGEVLIVDVTGEEVSVDFVVVIAALEVVDLENPSSSELFSM